MTKRTKQYLDLINYTISQGSRIDLLDYETEVLEEAYTYLSTTGKKVTLQEWIVDELTARYTNQRGSKYADIMQRTSWAVNWSREWEKTRKKINPGARMIITVMVMLFVFATRADAKTLINMGECKITYYCACSECSGPWGDLTATGTRCEEGRTVAVDPDVIAYGTKLLINGRVYTAEDCGGNVHGDHIDIYLDDHERTEKLGVNYTNVWIVKGGEWDE